MNCTRYDTLSRPPFPPSRMTACWSVPRNFPASNTISKWLSSTTCARFRSAAWTLRQRNRRTTPLRRRRRGASAGRLRRREAGCAAAADPDFGSEGGRRDRPRHSGCGQARGLAARPRPLQLRGPHQRAPLRVPTPAADRSRRAVCPGRRRRAEQSPPAVRGTSPRPPRRRRIRRPPRRGSSGADPVQPRRRRRKPLIKVPRSRRIRAITGRPGRSQGS